MRRTSQRHLSEWRSVWFSMPVGSASRLRDNAFYKCRLHPSTTPPNYRMTFLDDTGPSQPERKACWHATVSSLAAFLSFFASLLS